MGSGRQVGGVAETSHCQLAPQHARRRSSIRRRRVRCIHASGVNTSTTSRKYPRKFPEMVCANHAAKRFWCTVKPRLVIRVWKKEESLNTQDPQVATPHVISRGRTKRVSGWLTSASSFFTVSVFVFWINNIRYGAIGDYKLLENIETYTCRMSQFGF